MQQLRPPWQARRALLPMAVVRPPSAGCGVRPSHQSQYAQPPPRRPMAAARPTSLAGIPTAATATFPMATAILLPPAAARPLSAGCAGRRSFLAASHPKWPDGQAPRRQLRGGALLTAAAATLLTAVARPPGAGCDARPSFPAAEHPIKAPLPHDGRRRLRRQTALLPQRALHQARTIGRQARQAAHQMWRRVLKPIRSAKACLASLWAARRRLHQQRRLRLMCRHPRPRVRRQASECLRPAHADSLIAAKYRLLAPALSIGG